MTHFGRCVHGVHFDLFSFFGYIARLAIASCTKNVKLQSTTINPPYTKYHPTYTHFYRVLISRLFFFCKCEVDLCSSATCYTTICLLLCKHRNQYMQYANFRFLCSLILFTFTLETHHKNNWRRVHVYFYLPVWKEKFHLQCDCASLWRCFFLSFLCRINFFSPFEVDCLVVICTIVDCGQKKSKLQFVWIRFRFCVKFNN